jgi:putative ubiquitin-RnfH superfamily antitoxin RatB of RatAB toxin-antitoxin module
VRVEVVYCPSPGVADLTPLDLAGGATLADALAASGLLQRHALDPAALCAGVWGRVQAADAPLREGDRVEVYRVLRVDPKEARRQRYRQRKATAAPGR